MYLSVVIAFKQANSKCPLSLYVCMSLPDRADKKGMIFADLLDASNRKMKSKVQEEDEEVGGDLEGRGKKRKRVEDNHVDDDVGGSEKKKKRKARALELEGDHHVMASRIMDSGSRDLIHTIEKMTDERKKRK